MTQSSISSNFRGLFSLFRKVELYINVCNLQEKMGRKEPNLVNVLRLYERQSKYLLFMIFLNQTLTFQPLNTRLI